MIYQEDNGGPRTGDLITIPPGSTIYPTSSTRQRRIADTTLPAIVVVCNGAWDQPWVQVLLNDGSPAWIHKRNCQPSQKADRT